MASHPARTATRNVKCPEKTRMSATPASRRESPRAVAPANADREPFVDRVGGDGRFPRRRGVKRARDELCELESEVGTHGDGSGSNVEADLEAAQNGALVRRGGARGIA